MAIKPLTDLDLINGTSFHGKTLIATANELKRLFGPPQYNDNNGADKVNIEWNLVTDSGIVFSVYDWKEGRSIMNDEPVEWHIGTKTSDESCVVMSTVVTHLMSLLTKY